PPRPVQESRGGPPHPYSEPAILTRPVLRPNLLFLQPLKRPLDPRLPVRKSPRQGVLHLICPVWLLIYAATVPAASASDAAFSTSLRSLSTSSSINKRSCNLP